MKKISILLVVCMLLSAIMTACADIELPENTEPESTTVADEATNVEETSGEKSTDVENTDETEGEESSSTDDGYEETSAEESSTEDGSEEESSGEEASAEQTTSDERSTDEKTTEEATTEAQKPALNVSTVDEAVELAANAQGKVTGGELSVTKGTYFSETTAYAFGDGYLKAVTVNEDGEKTVHATLGENGKVCYVTIDPNNSLAPISINAEAKAKFVDGPALNLSNYINENVDICGAYELLDFFYMQYPYTSDEEIEITESVKDGVCSFSYSMVGPAMFYGTATYTVNVSFTLDSKNYYINTLTVTVDAVETYSSETAVITYIQSDDAALRITEGSKYGIDDIMPTELAFKDADGNVITFTDGVANVINAPVTEYNGIAITVTAPENGLLSFFGEVIPFIKDSEGNEISGVKAYAYFSADTNKVVVNIHEVGEYYVYIPIGEDTYIVPINANWNKPTEDDFNPTYFDLPKGASLEEWMPIEKLDCYTGQNILLRVDIAQGCKQDMFTATIKDNASGATLSSSSSRDYTYDGKNDLVYTFAASEVGTYTIVFTSTDNAAVKKEITLNVLDAPEISELTAGKWTYNHKDQWGYNYSIAMNFYPVNSGSGTLTVEYTVAPYSGNAITYNIEYSYSINNGEFKAVWVSETCTANGVTVSSTEYNGEDAVSINESYQIVFDGYELEHTSTESDARD